MARRKLTILADFHADGTCTCEAFEASCDEGGIESSILVGKDTVYARTWAGVIHALRLETPVLDRQFCGSSGTT